ncbi:hypothetical protein MBLNU459_g3190t1 [Dothideomycetes sp. NU459]
MSSPRKSVDSFSYESPLYSPTAHRSSAFPFPRYDSTSTFAAAQSARARARRGSAASNMSANSVATSIGGSLDMHVTRARDTVKEAQQNASPALAISTLVQPPGLLAPTAASVAAYRAPTTKDIPPVTLTNIPRVEPTAFNDYLARIGPLFDTFQRARAEQLSAASKTDDRSRQDSTAAPFLARQPSASSLLSPTVESPQPRRRSSAYTRRRLNEPTPLSTIPPVYFDDNFHLENPRTFDVVSERAEIVRPPPGSTTDHPPANGATLPPRKSLATNAILQEKLSWYMDTVEVHLINSISAASTSFFAALGSLRQLEHEAADSVTGIRKLRRDLATLDQEMAMGGLEVANLRTRHQNLRKLGRAVDQVARVVDDAKACEDMVDKGEYDAAVEAMNRLDKLIAGHTDSQETGVSGTQQLLDLRSLKALQGLADGMAHLRHRIGKGFESRFLEALLKDLRQHVDNVPPKDTLRRWANASQRYRGEKLQIGPPAYMQTNDQLRKDLLASLNGLSGSGQTAQATAAWRDAVMKEMKHLIRKHLPSSSDDDAESVTSVSTRGGRQLSQQEKSAVLARNLRALDDEAAEELFANMYTGVSEALRRLGVQIKVLLDVTSTVSSAAQLNSPSSQIGDSPINRSKGQLTRSTPSQDDLSQALDMSSLLGQAVDIAQTQITRILKVRSEQSTRLPLQLFLRYFTMNRLFADECEAVSGRSGSALKGIVNTQINAFVHALGDVEIQRIAQKLDGDQWEAKDFGERDQDVLSRILQGMSSDPAQWLQGIRIWEDTASAISNGATGAHGDLLNGTSKAESGAAPSKPQTRPAHIDETRFILVSSAMSLLYAIENFLTLIASIPSISAAATSALADVLRTFNSRTSQLILGAGATRIAGLKNITTKHLALASQALSFVIALTPYLREAVRRHAGAGSSRAEVLGEFDKVKRLYQEHQMGIHDKLVDIMTARATAHVNSMKKIDFDDQAAKGIESAGPYMETLTKETGTLYRVLSKHLSEPDVGVILAQIFASYRDQWFKAFSEADVKTAGGKTRLLQDAELFDARLGKIDGFGDIGRTVVEAVKAKPIAAVVVPEKTKSDAVSTETPVQEEISDEKKN